MINKIVFALNSGEDLYREHRALQAAWRYAGLSGDVLAGEGCYYGVKEQCYVVKRIASNQKFVELLCRKHNQESIMLVNAIGSVYFKYLNTGAVNRQGDIKKVTHYTACQSAGYTELNGECYIIQEA